MSGAFWYIISLPLTACEGSFGEVPSIKYVYCPTSLVEYDLVDNKLDLQNVLQGIFMNNLWSVKKGVVDVTLQGKVSD